MKKKKELSKQSGSWLLRYPEIVKIAMTKITIVNFNTFLKFIKNFKTFKIFFEEIILLRRELGFCDKRSGDP